MVKEMVVKEALSSEARGAGAALIRLLDEAHFNVAAALWFYNSDTNTWRFIVASPAVRVHGLKSAYKQVQSVLARIPDDQAKIALKDITVVDTNDSLIALLRVALRTGNVITPGIRFSQHVINGIMIEDAYIYRIT